MGTTDSTDPADPTDPTNPTDPGTDPGTDGEQSFGEPARLKAPSADQISAAVDATPTLEDQRSNQIPVPSYLQKHDDSDRLVGTMGAKTSAEDQPKPAPGFTNVASHDPTIKSADLSAPVISDEAPPTAAKSATPMLPIAIGLAVLAVVLVALLR